ncbi:MAG: tRNA (N(6)-L-threonylcarbamoyladenosine(37)-C(2))-methylthiotransferase [Thermoplasmata archaeon]|nr:tRNA (N(6)-L-threonylcarbamoyladenosine(37)-C(2))-methylthiotransferase [Thermoplasmata archaeon]
MRILLEAYGCTLNKGEANELAGLLHGQGHEFVNHDEDYDWAVLFTCGVIETTEQKMLKRISQLAGENKKLFVCGCLGPICESKILKVAPEAMLFPPASNTQILEVITTAISSCSNSSPMPSSAPSMMPAPENKVGILPIATGCLGDCAYCITRFARGPLKSRQLADIKSRARALINSGVAELQITAQDTAVYGMDIGEKPRLPDIMNSISQLDANFMARVGMMNPAATLEILEPLIQAFGNDRIFKFIHLPVQSGSDEILQNMGRKYTTSDLFNIIESLRHAYPDMTISTDIITGFPGETDDQFQDSVELVKKLEPDIINVTRFSPRPGTTAAKMKDQISGWKSKDRSRIITSLRFEISRKKLSARIEEKMKVIATEYRKPGTTFLRTGNYQPVVVDQEIALGEWYFIKIIGNTDTHLIGELAR